MLLLGFWVCVCMVFLVNAQEHTSRKLYCTDEDRAIFDRYCTQMEPKKSLPLDELMIHTALFFRGLLMSPLPWKRSRRAWWSICGIGLHHIRGDRIGFIPYPARKNYLENFCENLQRLRYREGTIGDYTDRLHYMTDWFYENERKES